jgi:ATP-dependent helicase/nuclease subunit A
MNMAKPERDIADVLADTSRAQFAAADPKASVWVNANAGTGKTHVLTLRVLRILLGGTAPERILCLTYTKAAAAEMSTRIFERLGKWVTASDADLAPILAEIIGGMPSAAQLNFARTLFTRAIETPGGLKIQTIHAFAERLLQRFPLEAGVPPGFKILDDEKGKELKAAGGDGQLRDAACQGACDGQPLRVRRQLRYAAVESHCRARLARCRQPLWLRRRVR